MDIRVELTEPGSGDERLEELGLRLAAELRQLEVDAIAPAADENAPEGTRSALAAVAGALVVSLRPTPKQLLDLVNRAWEWVRRSPVRRSVKMSIDGDTLEITGASAELQRDVVRRWVDRHATA